MFPNCLLILRQRIALLAAPLTLPTEESSVGDASELDLVFLSFFLFIVTDDLLLLTHRRTFENAWYLNIICM